MFLIDSYRIFTINSRYHDAKQRITLKFPRPSRKFDLTETLPGPLNLFSKTIENINPNNLNINLPVVLIYKKKNIQFKTMTLISVLSR